MRTRPSRHLTRMLAGVLVYVLLGAAAARGQQVSNEGEQIVRTSQGVLTEIMAVPAKQIPVALLDNAQGIAIVPNVVKGGFIVGARFGKGVVLIRDDQGNWSPPRFVTLTGGSVGWQAGVQSTDVILVFKSRNSIDGLLRGKITIGADVAASAGPLGRNLAAGTDAQLKSEVYSYSRSRGLFLGAAIDGSSIQVDPFADASYYGNAGPAGQSTKIPDSAIRLISQLNEYTNPRQLVASPDLPRQVVLPTQANQVELIRRELAAADSQLVALLDKPWKDYLALPREVFVPDHHADVAQLQAVLARFDAVAANPQYGILVQRPEFQATTAKLRQYLQALAASDPNRLNLPPPPSAPATSSAVPSPSRR